MSRPRRSPRRAPGRTPRRPAPRPEARSLVGQEHVVDVGPIAHGGHCVARLPEEVPDVGGTVVFVRHALPGEQVTARLTDGRAGDRFLRADAVAVHRPAPERVPPPCSYAGPGLCGGCDFQHVALPAQRVLKGHVVAEQLRRLAGLDVAVPVEPVPGDDEGLRWRTRMRLHRTPDGALGLRRHRSREVVPVDDCLIRAPGARVTVDGESSPSEGTVVETVRARELEVAADGFWQVHPGAPEALVNAVLGFAGAAPGERALDLFGGVGLFAGVLAEAVGERGSVLAVEGDRRASSLAERNLAAYPWARAVCGDVARVLAAEPDPVDVVVLDPPRTGARRPVVEAVAALGPRAVVYVACDPAAFARDVATFGERGYGLASLRAFDLFPMTHHVELVGLLQRRP
jgi:tRNA/tmRNA/rRNA uracil-C5-methylase (TrmA/RlmC/RlmD family)